MRRTRAAALLLLLLGMLGAAVTTHRPRRSTAGGVPVGMLGAAVATRRPRRSTAGGVPGECEQSATARREALGVFDHLRGREARPGRGGGGRIAPAELSRMLERHLDGGAVPVQGRLGEAECAVGAMGGSRGQCTADRTRVLVFGGSLTYGVEPMKGVRRSCPGCPPRSALRNINGRVFGGSCAVHADGGRWH